MLRNSLPSPLAPPLPPTSVQKNALTGKLEVASAVYRIKAVETQSGALQLFPAPHHQQVLLLPAAGVGLYPHAPLCPAPRAQSPWALQLIPCPPPPLPAGAAQQLLLCFCGPSTPPGQAVVSCLRAVLVTIIWELHLPPSHMCTSPAPPHACTSLAVAGSSTRGCAPAWQ